jgi:hypothetical protein
METLALMKLLSAIGTSVLVALTGFHDRGPIGLWYSSLIMLNGDTIFLASDSSYSIRYNLSSQGSHLRSNADSASALAAWTERFHENRKMFIRLEENGTVIMMKMRSGGMGLYPNEVDSGSYTMQHDTVIFTIRTRRDYQFALVHNPKRGILHLTDGTTDHMVYQEYRKEP